MNIIQYRNFAAVIGLLIGLSASARGMTENVNKVSRSMDQLMAIVDLRLHAGAVQWEAFQSPEKISNEFLESNPDYTILIAEFTSVDTTGFSAGQTGNRTYVVSEAPRPWLDEAFRLLLKGVASTSIDPSTKENCRPVKTTLKKNRKLVNGFFCVSKRKVLMYLTLGSYS